MSPATALFASPYLSRTILVVLCLTVARIVYLAVFPHPLYGDEAQYWAWSQQLDLGYYSKPPLMAWVIALTTLLSDSEFWIRLGSPLAHLVAALGIYASGTVLYNARIGFWAALLYSTLPAVFVSSVVMSTDPVLLACWAWGLFFISAGLVHSCRWSWLLAGLCIGLAMLAKYNGVFLLIGAIGLVLAHPEARPWRKRWPFWGMILIALAVLSPNLWWNTQQGFVTLQHTKDNANLGADLLNLDEGLAFIGSQFAVFGPVLFTMLLWQVWQSRRGGLALPDALLLWCCLPVLLFMIAQGFLSRANANWAAPAYVAASLFVAARSLESLGWLRGSVIGHSVILSIGLALAFVPMQNLPKLYDPFQRLQGYDAIIRQFEAVRARYPGLPVITDHRRFTALMVYYSEAPILYKWALDPTRVTDYFEQTIPFPDAPPANEFLLITTVAEPEQVTSAFLDSYLVDTLRVTTHANRTLTYYIWHLYGYRGR